MQVWWEDQQADSGFCYTGSYHIQTQFAQPGL